jgi:hypothetical protein
VVAPIPAKEAVKVGCHLDDSLGLWACTGEAISAAVHGLTDAAFDLREARTMLEQQSAVGSIDKAEMAGELWTMTHDRDHYRGQRWWFALGGFAAGVLGAGLLVGLVR